MACTSFWGGEKGEVRVIKKKKKNWTPSRTKTARGVETRVS